MQLEVLRLYADWLKDPEAGLNAIAAVVPRPGDASAPPPVTVGDATRDAWAALGVVPDELFADGAVLLVTRLGDLDVEPLTAQAPAAAEFVPVLLKYVAPLAREGEPAHDAGAHGLRVLRAARRVIAARFAAMADTYEGGVTIDGVSIDEAPERFRMLAPSQDVERQLLVLPMLALQPAQDVWARAGL